MFLIGRIHDGLGFTEHYLERKLEIADVTLTYFLGTAN